MRFRGPAPVGPGLRDACHFLRLGHPHRVTLHHNVRSPDRYGDRAPRIAHDIAALPGARSRLEPEAAIKPQGADRSHMRTAVLVDRGQPRRARVRRVRSRGCARIEVLDDGVPVHRRQPLFRSQVDDLHDTPSVSRLSCGRRPSSIRRPVMAELIAEGAKATGFQLDTHIDIEADRGTSGRSGRNPEANGLTVRGQARAGTPEYPPIVNGGSSAYWDQYAAADSADRSRGSRY